MKKRTAALFLLMISLSARAENEGVHVYDPVPGLAASEFYSFKVRTVGSTTWLDPFAFITRGKDGTDSRYYDHLKDWSNTYINFEMSNAVPVEIEISKVGGAPITNAVPHPAHKVNSCAVVAGKAYVVIDDPALFTVDIDGQMDEQDTARTKLDGWGNDSFYDGPPIHTLTVFANPFLQNKPDTNDPNVFLVQPGVVPAGTGTWNTLYFLPGVHDIGRSFRVHEYKNYYIPGDAVVHGTFNNNKEWGDGNDIRIFGHGTLSGERIPHPDDDTPPAPNEDDWLYKPIDIQGARDTSVEGITIADSAMHSLMLVNSYQPDKPTDIRWVKIFTWRANGDGINPFGNGLIEDCFIRTADDCTYVNGRGIRRCVFWTDVNGSAFTMSPIGNTHTNLIVVEDCDIIYNRSIFYNNQGGRVFNLRGAGNGAGGANFVFRNIRVSDPRPTRSAFGVQAAAPWQKAPDYEQVRGAGDISGILFQNIEIAAHSIIGDPETLWGNTNTWLRNFTFDTVTVAGELIDDLNDFNHNEYVTNMVFLGPPYLSYAPTVLKEGAGNDGHVVGAVGITLTNDTFTADVVSAGHVTVSNVPPGLTPVFARGSDTQVMLSFSGSALNHASGDSMADLSIAFSDGAFASGDASGILKSTNSALGISFLDQVLFLDTFEDGNIATATTLGDINGGFDIYKVNDTDAGLQIYETSGNGVLDLTGAATNFPWMAMMSKGSFDGVDLDCFELTVEVAGLEEAWWYLRPFTINLRPNAAVNAQTYNPGATAPPLGLSLMVGNQDTENCRVALVAYDGTTANWLWEDLDVMHKELADGFTATITVNRTNGWQLAFSGAASLPASISNTWSTLGWTDIFNGTTYVQCYLREDGLSGQVPPRPGRAKAEISSIEIKIPGGTTAYDIWTALWGEVDLSDPSADYDHDGASNLDEYALNGNPTNPADRGLIEISADPSWFTMVHASNTVDSSLIYRLLDRTNLVSGAVNTNGWSSQTIGPVVDDYSTVSNHYSATGKDGLFIQLQVGQE
ncbi:glycoside hydrolase family protein [Pontiella desulfatans]|nr:hypothetical protein [Pontiella desulfatans]